ncbi:unnamed protein product [Lepidochelys kempii]
MKKKKNNRPPAQRKRERGGRPSSRAPPGAEASRSNFLRRKRGREHREPVTGGAGAARASGNSRASRRDVGRWPRPLSLSAAAAAAAVAGPPLVAERGGRAGARARGGGGAGSSEELGIEPRSPAFQPSLPNPLDLTPLPDVGIEPRSPDSSTVALSHVLRGPTLRYGLNICPIALERSLPHLQTLVFFPCCQEHKTNHP